jgi:uncharacterized membrane protein YhhN
MRLASNYNFARLVVIGLLLGGIGDVLLNLRFVFEKSGQKIFLVGIAAFLSGHIMYVAALILLSANPLASLICGAFAAVLLLRWIFGAIGEVKKAFKIVGFAYIGAIMLMTALAIGDLISNPGSTSALLYVIGAVFFTASDVIMILTPSGKLRNSRCGPRTSRCITWANCLLPLAYSIFDCAGAGVAEAPRA